MVYKSYITKTCVRIKELHKTLNIDYMRNFTTSEDNVMISDLNITTNGIILRHMYVYLQNS